MLRIAIFADCFPVISETFILRQITGLIDLGHHVRIFADRRPEPNSPIHAEVLRYNLPARTMYLEDHVPVASGHYEMPVWPLSEGTWLPGADAAIPNEARALQAVPVLIATSQAVPKLAMQALDPAEYSYQARSFSALYRLHALLAVPFKFDVLHAHFGSVGNTFRFARELWNAPLVVSFHGFDAFSVPTSEGMHVYRKLFQTADLITVNSRFMGAKLRDLGCIDSKLRMLSYGLDIGSFEFCQRRKSADETVRLLTVARLVEKKGTEYCIRAVHRMREKGWVLHYDIVGDGPLRGYFEGLIGELALQESVILHGALKGDDVMRMIANAHLFLLASVTAANGDREGTPVSLIEAQASGLPVVSTLHSGIPEIVADGRSGFLVPERDVDALVDRLTYLVEHPQLWPELGGAGRELAESQFDIQKVNQQLVGLYHESIEMYRSEVQSNH